MWKSLLWHDTIQRIGKFILVYRLAMDAKTLQGDGVGG